MADTLSIISIVSFILSGIIGLIAIILFFVYKIPSVMGDLSGRNAKRSIEKMRQNNEKNGKITYPTNGVNVSRENIPKEKNKGNVDIISQNGETGLLHENYKEEYSGSETGILMEGTTLLKDENATTVLNDTAYNSRQYNNDFEYLEDIMMVHTREVI